MDGYRSPVRLCGEIKLAILVIKTGHSWYQNYTILIPLRAAKKNVQYVTTHNFNFNSFHPNHSGGADWICSETVEAVDFLDPTESTQLFSMSGLKLYCRWQRRKCHRQPHPQKSQQNCREGAPTALKPHEATNFPHGFLRKLGIYPNVWLLFMGKMCFSGYQWISWDIHDILSTPHFTWMFQIVSKGKGRLIKRTRIGKMHTRIHQNDPTCP